MKQRLIYILKHNAVIQKLYRICMSAVFRLIGAFVTIDPQSVLFVSYMGTKFNDSPKMIYEYMQEREEFKKYHCIWALDKPEDYPQLNTVKMDSFAYFLCALKAKYWVTNTNIERGLRFKKKGQIYLNTWHGVAALKTIGNDCPGRKDYNFDTLDYMCVSGKPDEVVFRSAFNARESSYIRCGMPRNDQLWNATEDDRQRIRKKLGVSEGKRVILYAPTWRDSVDGGKTYELKPPVDFEKWERVLGDNNIVFFRAHQLTTSVMNVRFNSFVRDVSDYPDVNELLIATDILITDYSSIAFDFSILCRPIFCFAYDYDTYLAERGTYFDIDEKYPEKSNRTEDALLTAILNTDMAEARARTRVFRDYFVEYRDNATKRCVETLFS